MRIIWNAYQRLNRRQKQLILLLVCVVIGMILTQAAFHSLHALAQAAGTFIAALGLWVVCFVVAGRKPPPGS